MTQLTIMSASAALAIAKPNFLVGLEAAIAEVGKAISEAAEGGLTAINVRLKTVYVADIVDALVELRYTVERHNMSDLIASRQAGVAFYKISWAEVK